MRKGFSVIEILIVIALFSVLSVLVAQSITQSFRGTRKVDAAGDVRDNLNLASDIVERHIRNAKSITSTCDSASHGSIAYTDQLGNNGSFSCLNMTGSDPQLASGSANLRITSVDVSITSCSFRCTTTSTVTPPIIDFVIAGRARGVANTDESFTTVSRRIVLRVY